MSFYILNATCYILKVICDIYTDPPVLLQGGLYQKNVLCQNRLYVYRIFYSTCNVLLML